MIPSAYPCVSSRYVKKGIKICEWVKNEISALNLLCNAMRDGDGLWMESPV